MVCCTAFRRTVHGIESNARIGKSAVRVVPCSIRGQFIPDPLRQVTLPDGRNVHISRGIGGSPPIPIGWRRGSDDGKMLDSLKDMHEKIVERVIDK